MKRLVVCVSNAADGRVDRIVIDEGVTLRDTDDAKTNRPFIPIGALVAVELLDDGHEADEAGATVTTTPDPPPEKSMRTLHIEPVSVPGRWGGLPLDEEATDG